MGFVGLQEALRRELRRRIAAGDLTGMELARKTGFTQAHISNFINRKRGLKLRALDRMLKALGLTLYDLLDPRELARHAALPVEITGEFLDVPIVDAASASSPTIVREQVREMLKFRRAFLDRIRAVVPGVVGVHMPVSGTARLHAYVQIRKSNDGEPKTVIATVRGMGVAVITSP